jgi:phosphatidylglycerol:prolipoprotein diacylglycerol transferase
MYCVWYGFGRAIIETMRTDSLMVGPFKVSFLLSLLICIAALVALLTIYKKKRTTQIDTTYESIFKEEIALEESEERQE